MLLRLTAHAVPAAFLSIGLAFGAEAHELWIEPLRYEVAVGSAITADLRVGEAFAGRRLPYLPARVRDAGIIDAGGRRTWHGLVGDLPAVRETARHPGLSVLYYHSHPSRITHAEPGGFARFLEEEGLAWALEAHRGRGLPETGFTEAFSRCAKSLVRVGAEDGGATSGAATSGADVVVGMPLELVAEANPYALAGAALPVRLLWQGRPLADAQITIFRAGDRARVSKVRTGADGRALIPLAGAGSYLLNAVHIIPWHERPNDAWHSHWASLTFALGLP